MNRAARRAAAAEAAKNGGATAADPTAAQAQGAAPAAPAPAGATNTDPEAKLGPASGEGHHEADDDDPTEEELDATKMSIRLERDGHVVEGEVRLIEEGFMDDMATLWKKLRALVTGDPALPGVPDKENPEITGAEFDKAVRGKNQTKADHVIAAAAPMAPRMDTISGKPLAEVLAAAAKGKTQLEIAQNAGHRFADPEKPGRCENCGMPFWKAAEGVPCPKAKPAAQTEG